MLCPRCDYDLTGLPVQHTCPECGCNYDEHSIGIELTGRRNEFWAAGLVGGMMLVSLIIKIQRGKSSSELVGTLVSLFLVGFFLFWRLQRRAGSPSRIILDALGTELATKGQEPLRWPWRDIRRVEVDWMWGTFTLYDKEEQVLIARNYRALGTLKLAKRCAAEINKRLELYSPRTDDPPRPAPPTEG